MTLRDGVRIVVAASISRKAGGTYYARKLAEAMGARLASVEQPLPRLMLELWRRDADVCLVEFEYATFGSVMRSLPLLPLLVFFTRWRHPVVVRLHGVVTEESLRGTRLARLTLLAFHVSYKLTAAFASGFIVCSDLMRTTLESDYRIPGAWVIPLGSDAAVPGPSDPRNLVFFGFVRPSKGLEELIAATALLRKDLPDLHLVIAGGLALRREGEYLDRLRDIVRRERLEGSVEFRTGFLSEEEKVAIVRSARVIVLPYTDRFVEVSGVLHDLAAYGLPVVCSDTPRFSEVRDGVECLKSPPAGPDLARVIRSVWKEPALAARLGDALRRKALAESWDAVAARHLNVLETVIGRHDGS